MPDTEKKKLSEDDADKKEVRRDALGNEIENESGPPPLENEQEKGEEQAAPDTEVKAEEETEKTEEPKRVLPPDLVPTPEPEDKLNGIASKEPEESGEPGPALKTEPEPKSEAASEPEPKPDAKEAGIESEDTPFDDEKTDQAIDDIVAKEGDDLLAAQDAAAAKGKVEVPRKSGGFWRNRWVRYIVLFIILGGITAALVVPASRYWTLNAVGVRSGASLTVVDSTTQLPLKGVDVSLGNKQTRTDSDGKASFSGVALGAAQLTIEQVGFEEIHRDIVVGWGSNPLGNFSLKATGVQYVIEVKDYLSERALKGVEATNGGVTAVSGKDGKITLTLENTIVAKGGVTLSKAGYRSETINLNEDPKQVTQATMVIAQKAVFVSKQSGKYDLYKSDIDGKNREVLLAGTGNENSNISLAVNQDGTRVAYVSTRDDKRDDNGFLLSSLILINIENGNKVTIAEATQIQLIDWIGSRLVFQSNSSDSGDMNRNAVVSYEYVSNTRVQLAAAKKLQVVLSARGSIYYAPAADSADPDLELGLFKIGPDGKSKQKVFDSELSGVLRSAYNTFNLQVADGTWASYDLASGAKTQIGTPSNLASRLYADNEGRTKSLWIDQGTMKVYDVAAGNNVDVANLDGITYPLRWASDSTAIFRVSNAIETADYAVSLSGGTPRKIVDVTPTYGFSQAQ